MGTSDQQHTKHIIERTAFRLALATAIVSTAISIATLASNIYFAHQNEQLQRDLAVLQQNYAHDATLAHVNFGLGCGHNTFRQYCYKDLRVYNTGPAPANNLLVAVQFSAAEAWQPQINSISRLATSVDPAPFDVAVARKVIDSHTLAFELDALPPDASFDIVFDLPPLSGSEVKHSLDLTATLSGPLPDQLDTEDAIMLGARDYLDNQFPIASLNASATCQDCPGQNISAYLPLSGVSVTQLSPTKAQSTAAGQVWTGALDFSYRTPDGRDPSFLPVPDQLKLQMTISNIDTPCVHYAETPDIQTYFNPCLPTPNYGV